MAIIPEKTPAPVAGPADVSTPTARRGGLLGRVRRLANRPWASGFGGFLTTIVVLLPVEYEAPLRWAALFVTMRRL